MNLMEIGLTNGTYAHNMRVTLWEIKQTKGSSLNQIQSIGASEKGTGGQDSCNMETKNHLASRRGHRWLARPIPSTATKRTAEHNSILICS
uniref:Uncharacterized protein n=1 Tax=Arundo donax TaxID=35708 RepID=A0A0A9DP22_ARUDO